MMKIMEINGQIHFNTARKFCLVSKFYAVTSDEILRKMTSPLTKAKAPLCVKPPPCRRVSDKVEANVNGSSLASFRD